MIISPQQIDSSPIFMKYKDVMTQVCQMYMPVSKEELSPILDYSINKRYSEDKCRVENSYTNKNYNMTILKMTDYILSKEPIVTAHGTMFKKHADCPNPMGEVIQQFLDKRSEDKKMMFKFPKGSEDYEKYNLMQILDKIDANGSDKYSFVLLKSPLGLKDSSGHTVNCWEALKDILATT